MLRRQRTRVRFPAPPPNSGRPCSVAVGNLAGSAVIILGGRAPMPPRCGWFLTQRGCLSRGVRPSTGPAGRQATHSPGSSRPARPDLPSPVSPAGPASSAQPAQPGPGVVWPARLVRRPAPISFCSPSLLTRFAASASPLAGLAALGLGGLPGSATSPVAPSCVGLRGLAARGCLAGWPGWGCLLGLWPALSAAWLGECRPPCSRWFGGGIRWRRRSPWAGWFCLMRTGPGAFSLSLCRCTWGFPRSGGVCSPGFCLLVGP